MTKLISLVASLSVALLLAACGGGDDSPTVSAVDKYVGTWKEPCNANSSGSTGGSFTITKTSDTTLSFSSTDLTYTSSNCSGTPTQTKNSTGTGTFRGTKTLGTDTVDKLDTVNASNGGVQKQVFVIKNGLLFSGRTASDGGAVDSDGYPTTLETNGSTKQ